MYVHSIGVESKFIVFWLNFNHMYKSIETDRGASIEV